MRWSTIEKECYAIVYCLKKLNYLLGDRAFTLKTDHKNLIYVDADNNEKVKRWKIAIQQYDITIEYIKGPDNIIADGMSRLVHTNKVAHGIAVLREIPMEIILSLQEYDLDSIVETHNLNILKEFVVPSEKRKIIAQVHNSISGHGGVERTFDKLVKMGHHWEYMREHVRYFIKRCPYCQKMSYTKTPIHTTPFTTAAYAPFDRQNWDSIGPLTLSNGEVCYILVAIDCFSRWVELWKIPDTEMLTVRLPMLQHFGRYGTPSQFLTDNGTQFVNGTVEELLKMVSVQHITVLAYSKEENAIVERSNKEVMRHVRALVFEGNMNENLEDLLPSVQRIINASRVDSTQASPAEILFGNAVDLDKNIFLPASTLTDMNVSLSTWASNMLENQRKIIKKAATIQRKKDNAHIASADPRRTEFAVGSYVLLDHTESTFRKGPPSKFDYQLRGPFRVVKQSGDVVTVYDSNKRKDKTVHIATLHPFLYESNYIDPVDVAQRDVISLAKIDKVLECSGDKKGRRSQLDFLVSYVGYDDSKNRWHPYSEIRDNPIAHEFMWLNNMKSFIPEEHRIGRYAKDERRGRRKQR